MDDAGGRTTVLADGEDGGRDWGSRSTRGSMASHRLVGWIYWDPGAIERYAALGVPGGVGYYIASRGAPLAAAGNAAVAAAFYSILPAFVAGSLDLARTHTTFARVIEARDAAVGDGLRRFVPEIVEPLSELGPYLWEAADRLEPSGRVLFAAHREAARPDDPVVSAWLAVNCIREWRGDTHWALIVASGLTGVQAGLLHDAYLGYPGEWIPRSRGADDDAVGAALAGLDARGLASGGLVNAAGIAFREQIEQETDRLSEAAWRLLGADRTDAFLDLVEPVGARLLERIDATAGPEWMPAARARRPPTASS